MLVEIISWILCGFIAWKIFFYMSNQQDDFDHVKNKDNFKRKCTCWMFVFSILGPIILGIVALFWLEQEL